jgi:acyl carrier protein
MFKRSLSAIIIITFFVSTLTPIPTAHADSILGLPAPGTMVNLSPAYEPVIIKGLTVHKDNPFLFDFIVDVGQDKMSGEPLKKEGEKLIKYFLASLAIPDKDVWVNLSPYEKNRMIPDALGQTDMGRDLLEQDYILKQITASLIYPEKQLGKTFWDKVYSKAQQMYGTTQIPVNTFNKVWIMADRAEVFEHNQTAFVVDSHLKVMLEEDYLALQKHSAALPLATRNDSHSIGANIIKQIILPELEKEVNTGKNFANLHQILNSLILANWYKKNLRAALLNQVYTNQSKIKGIDLNDPTVKQQIYEQYLKAYKKGVFNYIKEDVNTEGTVLARKYFSGGFTQAPGFVTPTIITSTLKLADSLPNRAMVSMATGFINHPMTASIIDNIQSHEKIYGASAVALLVAASWLRQYKRSRSYPYIVSDSINVRMEYLRNEDRLSIRYYLANKYPGIQIINDPKLEKSTDKGVTLEFNYKNKRIVLIEVHPGNVIPKRRKDHKDRDFLRSTWEEKDLDDSAMFSTKKSDAVIVALRNKILALPSDLNLNQAQIVDLAMTTIESINEILQEPQFVNAKPGTPEGDLKEQLIKLKENLSIYTSPAYRGLMGLQVAGGIFVAFVAIHMFIVGVGNGVFNDNVSKARQIGFSLTSFFGFLLGVGMASSATSRIPSMKKKALEIKNQILDSVAKLEQENLLDPELTKKIREMLKNVPTQNNKPKISGLTIGIPGLKSKATAESVTKDTINEFFEFYADKYTIKEITIGEVSSLYRNGRKISLVIHPKPSPNEIASMIQKETGIPDDLKSLLEHRLEMDYEKNLIETSDVPAKKKVEITSIDHRIMEQLYAAYQANPPVQSMSAFLENVVSNLSEINQGPIIATEISFPNIVKSDDFSFIYCLNSPDSFIPVNFDVLAKIKPYLFYVKILDADYYILVNKQGPILMKLDNAMAVESVTLKTIGEFFEEYAGEYIVKKVTVGKESSLSIDGREISLVIDQKPSANKIASMVQEKLGFPSDYRQILETRLNIHYLNNDIETSDEAMIALGTIVGNIEPIPGYHYKIVVSLKLHDGYKDNGQQKKRKYYLTYLNQDIENEQKMQIPVGPVILLGTDKTLVESFFNKLSQDLIELTASHKKSNPPGDHFKVDLLWVKQEVLKFLMHQVSIHEDPNIDRNTRALAVRIYADYWRPDPIKSIVLTKYGFKHYLTSGIKESELLSAVQLLIDVGLAKKQVEGGWILRQVLDLNIATKMLNDTAMTVTVNYNNAIWVITIDGTESTHQGNIDDLVADLEDVLGEGIHINNIGNELLIHRPGEDEPYKVDAENTTQLNNIIERILRDRVSTESKKSTLIAKLPALAHRINEVLSAIRFKNVISSDEELSTITVRLVNANNLDLRFFDELTRKTGVYLDRVRQEISNTPDKTLSLFIAINPRIADKSDILDAVAQEIKRFAPDIDLNSYSSWIALKANAAMTATKEQKEKIDSSVVKQTELLESIEEILVEQFRVNPHAISLDANLIKSLRMNSSNIAAFIVAIEEEFGLKITDEDAEKFNTVEDVFNYVYQHDAAMTAHKAALANVPKINAFPGGIDLNTSNGMQWKVSKDGQGVEMNIDPAMIARIERDGKRPNFLDFGSLYPIIFKITPVVSIWPLVGLQAPAQAEERLAAV